MAWSDQCKIAFAVTVRAKRNLGVINRSVNAIIKEISKESGVPPRTLHRWWAEAESATKLAKNGKHDTTHQDDEENQVDQEAEVDHRPLCQCGRQTKPGKVKADGARSYYKSCQKCLRATAAPKRHAIHNGKVYDGLRHAELAIAQLERIEPDDPMRTEAIQRVLRWIGQHHTDATEKGSA